MILHKAVPLVTCSLTCATGVVLSPKQTLKCQWPTCHHHPYVHVLDERTEWPRPCAVHTNIAPDLSLVFLMVAVCSVCSERLSSSCALLQSLRCFDHPITVSTHDELSWDRSAAYWPATRATAGKSTLCSAPTEQAATHFPGKQAVVQAALIL
jgi:hypothetical protein